MSNLVKFDGTADFSSGVNCSRTPTVQSSANPHGLPRTALAWLTNGTTRGGGVTHRPGWQPVVKALQQGLYQGGYLYDEDGANPSLVLSISGTIWQVFLEEPFTVRKFDNVQNPPLEPFAYFCQAEQFLIIQAGDGSTLPLFFDGVTIRRSNGLTGQSKGAQISELPASSCMVYYAGRVWYARDNIYTAGDIVRGDTGTIAYGRRDSVLRVTENPLAFGGDGFSVPISAGIIRALTYPANIDTSLGQGPLLIGTRKAVYSLTVPVSRAAWTSASDNQPLQVVAQIKWGMVNDRSVTHVNGDVFYQTVEPGIRSLAFARRNYGQWPNVPLSNNVSRISRRSNRALLRYSTGINFDNRLLMSALPVQTAYGVVHRALVSLDFDPLSSIEEQLPPVWEGHYEGLQVFQLFEGDFGGLQRGFAVILSETNELQVWEMSREGLRQNGDNRLDWRVETPAFTWADTWGEFDLKRLVGAELNFDHMYGTATITVEFRPDYYPCWILWHEFDVCSARNSAEDPFAEDYPIQEYQAGSAPQKVLPKPPEPCIGSARRPATIGTQFQVRLTIRGTVRIRSIVLFAEKFERPAYYGLVC